MAASFAIPLKFIKDLISYKVVSLNPFQLEECAEGNGNAFHVQHSNAYWQPPIGDLCGSVYLDGAFERHIVTLVGEEQYSTIRQKTWKKMLQEFEMSVKRSFDGEDQKHYSVDLHGVKDDPKNGIDDETIYLRS